MTHDQKLDLDNLTLTQSGPKAVYLTLADHIDEKIRAGDIRPGDRLPAQRRIAERLNVNLTTVSRAFKVLHDRGLISSRAGSGSIVRTSLLEEPPAEYSSAPLSGLLDLTVNRPATNAFLDMAPAILAELPADPRYASLQDYHPPEGASWLRTTLAEWLQTTGALENAPPERLIVTLGAQHALDCILRNLCDPGDTVLADAITYQGVTSLCHALHLHVGGVGMDAHGMRPDALEAACRAERPKAIILVPTLHNPTAITLSAERRRALVGIARAHDIPIIEDDVYRALHDDPGISLTTLAPERNYYIGGFSKCIAPGLRIGFVLAPEGRAAGIATALRVNTWCASPLSMLVATHLLESGKAGDIIERQKTELRKRQKVLADVLGDFDIRTYPSSTHAWLTLPPRWSTRQFVSAARRAGVAVLGSDLFSLTPSRPEVSAIRLNVAAPRSVDSLTQALTILRQTLQSADGNAAGAF